MSVAQHDDFASLRLARLQHALDAIAAHSLSLDFMLLTGDLAETGAIAEYRQLATLLQSIAVPTFLMPGNHDDRNNMRSVFPGHFGTSGSNLDFCFAIERPSYRVLAVDSSVTGCEHGWLPEHSLDWLREQLSKRICPTAIALHHPPFRTGHRAMDDIGIRNAHELRDAVAPYRHVRRILCGHLHRTSFANFHGVPASTVGSLAFELPFDTASQSIRWLNDVHGVVHVHHIDGGEFVTNELMAAPIRRLDVSAIAP